MKYKTPDRKLNVAILGGAFNPITKGHIQLAQFVLNSSNEFDEVWLMPTYKHIFNKEMASPEHRIKMCRIASKIDDRIKVFDFEIKNKLSGETYNLFKRLKKDEELNNKYNFSMIIGLDNANNFHKWVNFKELERMVRFIVVPRKGYDRDMNINWYLERPHIFLKNDCNIIEVSSTKVRNIFKNEVFDDINKYLDQNVIKYINKNKLYY